MIDRKNVLLILAVLAVAGVVGVYLPYKQYQSRELQIPTAAVCSKTPVIVHYTNAGFDPSTITISANTTVEWMNISDNYMWVASNPHPSHTDLPGFDEHGIEGNVRTVEALIPVAQAHVTGGIYCYTFIKIGHWGYHNHLVPADHGVVIVQ